ncbi:MAG: DsbA family protein [Pseudomonas sp.]
MSRRIIVLVISIITALGFAAAAFFYQQYSAERESAPPPPETNALVRFHSPVIGPANAPVTIVEFFDPSCEACRAFYPIVKQIMAKHPDDVRLVMRYVLFHQGSEEAARILETARGQGLFAPVLEAVLEAQPAWHDDPKAQKAWEAAAAAGLDVEKARKAMMSPEIDAVLNKDMADVKTVGVRGTPTFFVNGKPLAKFGAEPLQELVQSEIDQAR